MNLFLKFSVILLFLSVNFYGQQDTASNKSTRPTVGLVLSGGGAKGFAYIGLLKVLEEVNMPIDFIGGSSIGAIIGGLYATGYSPATIEQLIREEDWDALISDKLERKYLAYEEKLFSDKYIFSVPVNDSGITLSTSLSSSFNIDLMLNNLFSPAAHISNFDELPIPFLCIGTDLFSGEVVVLDSGNLARAVRSSMAIPGYFSPVYFNGHTMVDGGMVNNYPGEQVKARGLDIIIGGDVQTGLKTSMEELNSITGILDQVIAFHRIDANKKGKEVTDYYVNFKVPYGMMDFPEYDSIIAHGEKVARQHYSQLKNLADSINNIEKHNQGKISTAAPDSIYLDHVNWPNLDWKHREQFSGYFDGLKYNRVAIDDIEEKIKLIHGSRSFNELHYEFVSDREDTVNLDMIISEPNRGNLSAGLHYDNVYHGSVLVNLALRNIIGSRAKFFADIVLSQNPRFNSLFIINNGLKPGFGLETDLYSFSFPQYDKGKKINTWKFENISATAFMPLTIKNDFLFKTGFKYERFRFRQDIVIDSTLEDFNKFIEFGNFFVSFNLDTRDKVYFTQKGQYTELKVKYVFPLSDEFSDQISSATIFHFKYNYSLSLSRKIVFEPGIFAGYTLMKEYPEIQPYGSYGDQSAAIQHLFGFGGLNPNNYVENHIPFTGLRYIEKLGLFAGSARAHFRYNVIRNFYATLMADIGINEMDKARVIFDNAIIGYGLKLSYNSFIGPIEASVMGSTINQGATFFLNIGFWF